MKTLNYDLAANNEISEKFNYSNATMTCEFEIYLHFNNGKVDHFYIKRDGQLINHGRDVINFEKFKALASKLNYTIDCEAENLKRHFE